MKKLILTLLSFCLVLMAQAQLRELAKQKSYDETLNSTVLVVLKYSDSLNNRIKAAFQKYWTATPYTFVSKNYKDTLKPVRGQRQYSVFEGNVIRVVEVNMQTQVEKGTPDAWPGFYLAPLDQKKEPVVENIFVRSAVNSFYYEWSKEKEFENCFYRMDFIVKQANDIVKLIKTDKGSDYSDYKKQVNARASTLSTKTLLIPEELTKEYDINKAILNLFELGLGGKPIASKKPIWETMIKANDISTYKGKAKVLPVSEIEKLANSPEAGEYALFSPVINDMKIVFVYDLATKELIYTDQVMVSQKIKDKDFKELNKSAGL
jgi:hypothetical protein